MGRNKQDSGNSKAKRTSTAQPLAEPDLKGATMDAGRSGDWMSTDELRAAALAAVEAGGGVTLRLDGIDHLDASALQILLALDAEQKKRGVQLEITGASPHLRQWFAYAGAAEQFFHDGAEAR